MHKVSAAGTIDRRSPGIDASSLSAAARKMGVAGNVADSIVDRLQGRGTAARCRERIRRAHDDLARDRIAIGVEPQWARSHRPSRHPVTISRQAPRHDRRWSGSERQVRRRAHAARQTSHQYPGPHRPEWNSAGTHGTPHARTHDAASAANARAEWVQMASMMLRTPGRPQRRQSCREILR